MSWTEYMGVLSGSDIIFLYISYIFAQKAECTEIILISVWLMLSTSYLHHTFILWRETISGSFVKIWHHDVTWRHMTYFSLFSPKKCRRQPKICIMGGSFLFSKMALLMPFQRRLDQLYTIRGSVIVWFLVLSDFWWRHHENADVSRN